MSKFKTTGNNHFKNNAKHNTKHAPVDGREDNRGNWEGSLFQRGKEKIDEQCIKTDCPTGSFDPYNIPFLMNPKLRVPSESLDSQIGKLPLEVKSVIKKFHYDLYS